MSQIITLHISINTNVLDTEYSQALGETVSSLVRSQGIKMVQDAARRFRIGAPAYFQFSYINGDSLTVEVYDL